MLRGALCCPLDNHSHGPSTYPVVGQCNQYHAKRMMRNREGLSHGLSWWQPGQYRPEALASRLFFTHASSAPMLTEPGSPLKVKLLAQIQAGPVWNHTAQISYLANFGLDTAFTRERQMPLLPAVSRSSCLCTTEILLLTKLLRTRDTTH